MFPNAFLSNPWMPLLWVGLSWVIGVLGKDRRFGFFGNFLISFIFSPVVGVIVLLASDSRGTVPPRKYRKSRNVH